MLILPQFLTWKVRESEAEAILNLAEAEIIPKEFVEKIKGMPAFRNLDDFKKFSKYILEWISEEK